jgi:hypothetical protein
MTREDAVRQIVDAYTATRMTVPKFEVFVEHCFHAVALTETRPAGDTQDAYDRGFSQGYDEGWSARKTGDL